ncbi:MAG TPA: fused MFS/spermidine synthase [Coriobacteriia bacterium]
MLNAIVFVCGAALMGLEIVAARVLAPALGNSIFVWGAVISSVMVALSLGYWLGGQIADRFGASRTLAPAIAGSGLLTILAPVVAGAVLPWSADLGPRAGSLVASALIFFAPSLLMAMVTPMGIRLAATRGMDHIGRSAGSLSAVSTAGSIVGTLATSFWLIPLLSIEPLIVWIGFSLLAAALAALYLPLFYRSEAPADDAGAHERAAHARAGKRSLATALALVAAGVALGTFVLVEVAPPPEFNETGERVLFREDTQYHRITVTEAGGVRRMRFDKSNQSAILVSDPFTSSIRYPDYMQLALAVKPDAKRVLVLGLGGGAVTKRYWRDHPGLTVDSVEIDPVVVEVSKRYFGLPEDARSRVFVQDARRFVQTSRDMYDIVVIDCYYDDALPFHLTTQEFLREVKARTAPDGVVVYNVISALEGDRSKLFRSMYRTAGGVWDRLWVFRVNVGQGSDPSARSNNIVLASDADLSTEELTRRIEGRVDGRVSVSGFAEMARDLYTGVVRMEDVPVMTDAHAPTDALIDVR